MGNKQKKLYRKEREEINLGMKSADNDEVSQSSDYKMEAKETLRLAVPIMASSFFQLGTSFTTVMFMGHLGSFSRFQFHNFLR